MMNMKHARTLPALFAGALLISGAVAQAETQSPPVYIIDPTHAEVRMSWNHMGLSNPGATFEDVQGTIVFDRAEPANSRAEVTIPVSSVDTGVDALDDEFMGDKFFDAKNYPDITFKSTGIEFTGIGDAFTLKGDLTVKGVTRPVVMQGHLNGQGKHPMTGKPAVGFSATTVLHRSEFGLGEYVPMVSDRLDVTITVEASAEVTAGSDS